MVGDVSGAATVEIGDATLSVLGEVQGFNTSAGQVPMIQGLLWPASFTDYTLQFTTNLSGASWSPALPLPVVVGTNQVVTNAVSEPQRFYRLFKL